MEEENKNETVNTVERKEVKKEFTLPNKKVTVRLVDRARGVVKDKDHVMYNMLPGTDFEVCPKHIKGTSNIDCPLNKEEIEFFESKVKSGMTFEVGDLSPYAPKASNFWYSKRAKILLTNRDLELDLSKAIDYLKYKILLSNTNIVAPSAADEFKKKSYVFVITSDDEQQKKTISKGDEKKRAWKIATRLEDDIEGMIDYLNVIGKRVSENSKRSFLISEIDKQVESNIKEFLSTLEDPQYETKVLLTKSLQNKSVIRDGHKYFLASGDELVMRGDLNNLSGALNFLEADENQDIRLMLEAKLIKNK
jgi:hypothetical protein